MLFRSDEDREQQQHAEADVGEALAPAARSGHHLQRRQVGRLEADLGDVEHDALQLIDEFNRLPGKPGYFTETFCERSRFFQPKNGARVDAIREAIARDYSGTWLEAPLLASLILATDRVDSTTGVQMAYLKNWSWRSGKPIELKDPGLLPSGGEALLGDALELTAKLPTVDIAYLDPPYNQHRYFGNYHIWESLVRWDKPETYGVANKRIDNRLPESKSAFNSRKTMPAALSSVINNLECKTLLLSYNNESWLSRDELIDLAGQKGHVEILDFDFKRYVGSQIGMYNKAGEKVGSRGHSRNIEHLVVAGDKSTVQKMIAAIDK